MSPPPAALARTPAADPLPAVLSGSDRANPWLPAAPCSPAACIAPPSETAARPRRALRLLASAVLVLAGAVLAPAARGLGTARRIRLTSAWSRLLLRALGVRVEVRRGFAFLAGSAAGAATAPGVRAVPGPRAAPGRGSAAAGAASGVRAAVPGTAPLLVANHVSWLDPLVMAAALPCRLLAKREVRTWPVVGGLAAGSGALFIDRDRLTALPGAVGDVAEALAEGHPVAAFPEGTTWCGRGMGPFRPAVFQAALDAGAPVLPVAIRYLDAYRAPETGPVFVGDDTILASIRRVAAVRRMTVEVTVLPRVTARDRRTLAWRAESSVASAAAVPAGHGAPAVPAPILRDPDGAGRAAAALR
ncbi:lysophospholipid acyltransferase family protein [Planomonospora venezuelensis]|uniref:1-acyl-sn-glycerol-3-phosphate acyltransferase n=1 Tax=Planomonospora venezuelensis TaxID=1999 RepID=A0A841CXT9_PLAVE|nr:lysophospholipid acyltransferase family protein [Planomonospora venezuelensis]MBB5961134.1 1-acyl-sn-glycerol-3-phosphate acyltransferase [Planomonospora venezuelensis]GIM99804.1 1-acyl-sn-glycerol-3-phosphate acyltransferase [Planomonospora venezuelensis]